MLVMFKLALIYKIEYRSEYKSILTFVVNLIII
jgi:hypothetical protein